MALLGMAQQQYSDEDLAYHEAGHTVAALSFGKVVEHVSIDREDAYRGVRVPSFDEGTSPSDRILILLAGAAAQHVRSPASPHHRDAKDWPRAEALADSPATLDAEWERALTLLQSPENWQRVERIAQALLRERALDGPQLRQLMDRAP